MKINDNIHLGQTINPFESVGHFSAINRTASDFNNANKTVKKIKRLVNTG